MKPHPSMTVAEFMASTGVERRSKYGAVASWVGERRFASKKEARMFETLTARFRAGELRFPPLCQVPFHLPGRTRYVVDFLIQERDGRIRFIDAKGHRTAMFATKQRMVQDLYGVTIETM